MPLGGPNIYPGVLSWLGVARELTAGTPVNPVITHPLDQGSFEPEDTPKFLKDKAIRGAMTDLFYETLGVESATFSFGGPNFLDSHGYFMDNVFGDLSTTGSGNCNLATANSRSRCRRAGDDPRLSAAGRVHGERDHPDRHGLHHRGRGHLHHCRIERGELREQPAAVHPPDRAYGQHLRDAVHAPVRGTELPARLRRGVRRAAAHAYVHRCHEHRQPSSPTPPTALPRRTRTGPGSTPARASRAWTSSGNAEQLLGIKMSGDSWLSTAASSAVTNVTTNSRPIPNWNTTVVVAGNTISSTGTYGIIGEFSVSFKRQTQVYWGVQGTQTPYVIARGPLNMDGSIQWDPTNSETPLDLMLLNAQAPMTITIDQLGHPEQRHPVHADVHGIAGRQHQI